MSIYRLCLVSDRELAAGRTLSGLIALALRGGITMVQLREKTGSTRSFLAQALAVKAVLRGSGVPLIINDRIDIALAVDADGVHVGQSDMPVAQARQLLPQGKIIGLSITSAAQIGAADAARADYLGLGPIFAQTTKADASVPLGIDGFAQLRRLAPAGVPCMAIGGVKAEHAAVLRAAGADGLAVVSAIMSAADPQAAARAFGDD